MSSSANSYGTRVLQAIAAEPYVTQRTVSRRLGIALGRTNRVIRWLASHGCLKVDPRGGRYEVTPVGWEALAHARRRSFENTVELYTMTREQIAAALRAVSASCEEMDGRKRVIFYGAGDVGEIAYVSLQRTELTLVGVVDDFRRGRFFEFPIVGSDCLNADALDGSPYSRVIVASVRHADAITARLRERGVPVNRVCCP